MENTAIISNVNLPVHGKRKPVVPDPVFPEPVRGGEPKRIGEVMEPLQRIIEHPDRNRIMAEFFRRYW